MNKSGHQMKDICSTFNSLDFSQTAAYIFMKCGSQMNLYESI